MRSMSDGASPDLAAISKTGFEASLARYWSSKGVLWLAAHTRELSEPAVSSLELPMVCGANAARHGTRSERCTWVLRRVISKQANLGCYWS